MRERGRAIAPGLDLGVRVAAGNDTWNGSGLANTVPPGDEGFWFDFDINNDNVFNFYVYWYKMRSGRCDDGTVNTVPRRPVSDSRIECGRGAHPSRCRRK